MRVSSPRAPGEGLRPELGPGLVGVPGLESPEDLVAALLALHARGRRLATLELDRTADPWLVQELCSVGTFLPTGAAPLEPVPMDASQLAQIALEAGRLAAETFREQLARGDELDWDEKGVADYVTRVDREAEDRIVDHIRSRCPDHDIMAEESTDLGDPPSVRARFDGAEYLWIIDPLDGTTNFLHRYPVYAASVAVAHRGELVAGAIVHGEDGTEWSAWKGGGAWRDGARIQVSSLDRLDRALIGTGFPFKVPELLPDYLRQLDAVLRHTSGVRRAGAAALDLCHLADGRLDGFWELWLAPWDVAAGVVILREAGGVVTTMDGHSDVRAAGAIVAGNPAIHGRLRGLVGTG